MTPKKKKSDDIKNLISWNLNFMYIPMPKEKVNNLFNKKKHGENKVYSNGINDVKSR